MNRRKFIRNTTLTTAGIATVGMTKSENNLNNLKKPFQLKYAPHLGMFEKSAGKDPIDQLKFMADQGFSAFEDNGMKNREIALQEKMAKTMHDSGIAMGVFVAHTIYWQKPNLASGDKSFQEEFLKEIEESVEVAKRVKATWMTVVPGHLDLRLHPDYQTVNVVETLKRACEILEPHNLVMVLESLNFRNHPGLFLSESPHANLICKMVNSPSCKILFDAYHQQIQEGNIIPNIEKCWDEIAYFQVGDNPGRKEPTSGEMNYKNIFKFIHEKGFDGIIGMEHGNSIEGVEGEKRVIEAYREVDSFE